MKAIIISNGTIENYSFYKKILKDYDLIICADGGAQHAKHMGIVPDVVMGDFDSISPNDLNDMKSQGIRIVPYPPVKDETDTQLVINYAIEQGYKELVLLGCLGTRFDHSFANVALLKTVMDKGGKGTIINEYNEICLIDSNIELTGEAGDIVSLLPVTEKVTGVTISGFYYPLHDAELEFGIPTGISNVFTQTQVTITIKSGLLLVIRARD